MAITCRVGYPADTNEDKARERALTYVRKQLKDNDPVRATEVTKTDTELVVKITTGVDNGLASLAPETARDNDKLNQLAENARAFLASYEEAMGGANR